MDKKLNVLITILFLASVFLPATSSISPKKKLRKIQTQKFLQIASTNCPQGYYMIKKEISLKNGSTKNISHCYYKKMFCTKYDSTNQSCLQCSFSAFFKLEPLFGDKIHYCVMKWYYLLGIITLAVFLLFGLLYWNKYLKDKTKKNMEFQEKNSTPKKPEEHCIDAETQS